MSYIIMVECGERTCATQPGAFCRFVGTRNFGQEMICLLYRDEAGDYIRLRDTDGWVQRCKACLQAEGNTIASAGLEP